MKNSINYFTRILICSIVLFSCNDEQIDFLPSVNISTGIEPSIPEIPDDYTNITIPAHLSNNVLNGTGQNAAIDNINTPSNNPTTNEGATLGRVLFHDKNLSANLSVSCASCHQQENGFSDNKTLSEGFEGGLTAIHSMSLINAA